jgi:SsrA-binding protein
MPVFATNKRASHDYHILEKLEAGIALTGSEIKSVRANRITFTDSFVRFKNGQAWLVNTYIAPYPGGFDRVYDPRSSRKLLLHRRQIDQWERQVSTKNLTIVPLKMYTSHNLAKVEIALVEGKKNYDKRETLRRKDIQRDIDRTIRGKDQNETRRNP